jgi:low affinity Fe/Cu permease
MLLERFAHGITEIVGSSPAFTIALGIIVVWGLLGPLFGFSNTWQLVINTFTTIITFLMVFLLQRAQNKEALALQLKLNEIVAALDGASNRLINVEDLSEEEIRTLKKHYVKLVELARSDHHVTESHSIVEAEHRHHAKHAGRKKGRMPSRNGNGNHNGNRDSA